MTAEGQLEEKVRARLRATGLEETQLGIGATIRPRLDGEELGETLPAPDAPAGTESPRPLPRITVDLRGIVPQPVHSKADLEVRGLIGEGGMGRVFLTRQHSLDRDVAVKTAKDGAPVAAREALLFEGRITGQLEHPAIVPVHALGLDSHDRPALVMKHIEGVSWDELLTDPAHDGWEGWEGTPADLHELLTGQLRHEAPSTMAALISAHASEPFEYDETVPAELAELANRACHRDPAARLASAAAFRSELVHYLKHRDSVALATEARERLEALEALLAKKEPDEETRRAIDERAAEARFGLDQALASWPENEEARSARARLETLLDAQRSRAAELERMAREHDPRVGERPRAIALTVFAVIGVAMGTLAWLKPDGVTQVELIGYGLVIVVMLLGLTAVLGRRLMANRFGRQLMGMLFLAAFMLMVPRITALFVPLESALIFAENCLSIGAVLLMGGLTLLPWIAVVGLVEVAGGVALLLFPEHALPIFGTVTSVAVVLAAVLAHVHRSGSLRD